MIGILLVTHNTLGESLMDCVQHVLGHVPPNLKVLSVLANDDPEKKIAEGRKLIAELDSGNGVLLFTDLYGSTPGNIAQQLCVPGRVEGLAGVNMPMLLRAVCYRGRPLQEVMQKALESGRDCALSLNTDSGNKENATRCTNY